MFNLFPKATGFPTLFSIVLIAVMATSILILHVFSGSFMAPVLMLLVVIGIYISSRAPSVDETAAATPLN